MKEKLELERKEKKTRLIQLRYIREIKYLLRVQYFNQTRLWWSLLRKKDRLIYCSNVILIKTANWYAINYNMLINVIFQRSSLIFSTLVQIKFLNTHRWMCSNSALQFLLQRRKRGEKPPLKFDQKSSRYLVI